MKILPYLLLEIVMPGGTLLVLALWLYRNRKSFSGPMSIRCLANRLLDMKSKLIEYKLSSN
jgi:hypothetical protein